MSTLAMPAFNPFTFANKLKEAGVPEKQAVAEAELLHDVLAQQVQTVSALENQIKALTADTKRDAEQMATKGDVADVRGEVIAVRGDIKLLYWMLGMLIGLATAGLTGVAALVLKLYA